LFNRNSFYRARFFSHTFLNCFVQRGIGVNSVGYSLSLVASSEDKGHARIEQSLSCSFQSVHMDGRLLDRAQERVNCATKIVTVGEEEQRSQRDNQWFRKQADDAGLEIDEELLDDGLASGDMRDQIRLREAALSKIKLRKLLSEPMQTQRYGKFLTTSQKRAQIRIHPFPRIPAVLQDQSKKSKPGSRIKHAGS
jgi:hypothetical protein